MKIIEVYDTSLGYYCDVTSMNGDILCSTQPIKPSDMITRAEAMRLSLEDAERMRASILARLSELR